MVKLLDNKPGHYAAMYSLGNGGLARMGSTQYGPAVLTSVFVATDSDRYNLYTMAHITPTVFSNGNGVPNFGGCPTDTIVGQWACLSDKEHEYFRSWFGPLDSISIYLYH